MDRIKVNMSRRKQSNPKSLKRPYSELLVELAKSLNLPEDLSLKPRRAVCSKSLNSLEPDLNKDEQRQVNGVDESNDELKPKQTNKSLSKDHSTDSTEDYNSNESSNKAQDSANSLDEQLKIEEQEIGRRPCNGDLRNENNCNYNECSQSATRLDKNSNGIDNSTDDLNNNTKCNQNCCALFSIYTRHKLIKGHRFGPYLIHKLISTDNLNKQSSTDSNDKENRFSKIDFYQIQEPAGFWLKVTRTSSKPTAHLQIKENELWVEIIDDMNEENEICVASKYRFETVSKGLNRLSTTTMITDEILDKILEDEINVKQEVNDGSTVSEEPGDTLDTLENQTKSPIKDEEKSNELKSDSNSTSEPDADNDDSLNLTDPLNFVCKLCDIRFSNKNTLAAHQNFYCTKRQSNSSNSIGETLRMLASGLSGIRQSEKRPLNGNSNELNVKKHQIEEMCNNTSHDQVTVGGNSQMLNDVSSDSDELEKMVDEEINNSNNSNVSLNNVKSVHQQQNQSNDSNGLTDSTSTRFEQSMNLLLQSTLLNQDEQTTSNNEIIEMIHRLLGQSGNQNLVNNLLAVAAASQQRANLFICKFCKYTTGKRQQLIKHVRTNCEGLLNAVANLNSNLQSANTSTSSTTTVTTSSTTTNSTNTATTNCSSPITGEQINNEDSSNAAQLLNLAAAAISTDQLSSGCGNLACVNSNCSNGNSCVLLPNAGTLLNTDKFKATADDSEDDLMNSANPQDRYCMECEIQFASYKNYKVHKQIYCGSRHCSQKLQQPSPVNTNQRKRTISDTIANPSSIAAALTTSAAVTNITNLLGSSSPPKVQSNLFANQSSLSNLCKNGSLLSANANTSEAGSPGLQQSATSNLQASMAGLNSSNPLSSNSNAHQAALLQELFANGNIINLNNSLNIIQQLSQPVYIAISTNPLILLPINSALANVSTTANTNSMTTNSSTTTTSTTSNSKLLSTSSSQDVADQLLNNQLNGLLNQTVLDSLNKASGSVQRTGDEPMDLSSKRQKTSRFSGSNFEQNDLFANNPQLLNSISIDTLKALTNPANQVDLANAFLLPKSLSSLSTQQQLQLVLNQPRIYTCSNCQIDFHKQENYAVHKRHYCSGTKMMIEQQQAQKQSPPPTDDLETGNLPLNSGPNSPQSNQSLQTNNRASAASNSSNSRPTVSLVDTFNQATKKTSTSAILLNSKNSGCVSPSMSNSPIGSPPSFISSNQLTNNTLSANSSTITPAQPTYKHYCNKCGIRFTSKDNLQAHQTYYCTNNLNGLTSTITTYNAASGTIEFNCPKCRSSYGSEEAFLAHICTANASSQVSTVNSTSSINTQTNNTSTAGNTSANNLIDALESLKQHQTLTKLTSSLLNSAVSNSLIQANNLTTTKSNNNNQAFKCTICGYKGHTIRGMKTHVRVHGDQLQGNQEENFIISLSDECCSGIPLNGASCPNPNCRNTRSNLNSNKRRRSADPMAMLSNFLPTSSSNVSNISKDILLANNLSPLLSNSLVNGLMGNLMNNLTSVSHLVGGLGVGNSGLSGFSNTLANDGLSSTTSETEDNLDNVEQTNSLNTAALCNGTAVLSSSNNSIGKC